MENKLYEKNCITVDGRMDEPIWETAQEYTGFKYMKARGGQLVEAQSYFRILPCEDRIYIGIKNDEPYMDKVLETHPTRSKWCTDSVEFFMSPSGDTFEFYQFMVTLGGACSCNFYSEGGNICPDPYAPDWKYATYAGEDYWSAEFEIPLSAFYMTPAAGWQTEWLFNFCRSRVDYALDPARGSHQFYTWGDLVGGFLEPANFPHLDGFPMRPAENDIRIASADVSITAKTEEGYVGTMTVKTTNPQDAEFEFISDCAASVVVSLKSGGNEITVPCTFVDEGRHSAMLQLTRKSDGMVFKRYYPVRVSYEPIKLVLTLPEFRGNFYPGQDYSKVTGKVVSANPVVITLEGPGIGTKTATADAEGNFTIDTADMEYGVAMLTITDSVNTITQKIRRLEDTGRMMAWISKGNLIINGKPTLRRAMYAEGYQGGEAFKRRYEADDLHQTREICAQRYFISPGRLIPGSDAPGGEATKDVMPCDEMFRKVDEIMEYNKDRDFAYYYLDDEPECRGVSTVYLRHLYDYITDKDPYHVVLMASRGAGDYIYCTDWVESHAYINVEVRDGKRACGRPMNTLASYVEAVAKRNLSDKCVGFMPTCFSYKYSSVYADYPNFVEMVCHPWAAMLPGGKTLWSYAYHDLNDRASLYEGTRYVNSSFEALEDLVLLANRTELFRNREAHAVLYELNDEKMFVLVNLIDAEHTVTLDGISGTWYNFRHGGTITGNTFALKPYEVVIGTSKVRDAGLPTYQETAALIDELEYQRTHTGSLLFERYTEIPITATVPTSGYKLFDGIRDNWAWECNSKNGSFMELDLTKVKPTFSKVVIGGYQIDDMTLQVRNGGELTVPAIAEVKKEEFSTTFILSEPICPEALRMEFGKHRVELYEIEIF